MLMELERNFRKISNLCAELLKNFAINIFTTVLMLSKQRERALKFCESAYTCINGFAINPEAFESYKPLKCLSKVKKLCAAYKWWLRGWGEIKMYTIRVLFQFQTRRNFPPSQQETFFSFIAKKARKLKVINFYGNDKWQWQSIFFREVLLFQFLSG